MLVVDAGSPRNARPSGVHNYLGREGAPPGGLLADGRAEVTGYGGRVVTGTVRTARRLDGPLPSPAGELEVNLLTAGRCGRGGCW